MNRMYIKQAAVVTLVLGLLFIGVPQATAQVRSEHPRIWLDPGFKSVLIDRYQRNTPNAQNLRSWCDSHMNDNLDNYLDSRAVSMQSALNHALMYQLTGNVSYANRAVAIIEHAFANPYTGYTIDTWPAFDNFYTDRYLVPATATVLDWCYDSMSSTQRTTFVNQLDRWCRLIIDEADWGRHDPSNNYYYGHLYALLTAGYAIYGHHTDAGTYIEHARDVMLSEGIKYTKGEVIAWETLGNRIGRAKGGIWNEGTSYGVVNNEFIAAAVLAVQSAEGVFYEDFTFPNEMMKFYIYGLMPSGERTWADGDGAGGGMGNRVATLLPLALATGNTKRHGQHWINTFTANSYRETKLFNEFIWYDDQLSPLDYAGSIPDHYYAEGTQVLFWRDGWGPDACWMSFKIGLLCTDHAHNGLGDITIYKGGYLVADKAIALREGILYSDVHHNLLFMAPGDDKKLYWGASVIEHNEATTDYLYLAGDMSPVYLAQPDYRHNTVAHREREFFLLKGEKTVAIMDRGTTFNSGVDKIFQLYSMSAATQSGENYRTTSGDGSADLLIHTAYPSSGTSTAIDSYGLPRLRVTTATQSETKTFLHLLKVADRGGELRASHVQVNGAALAASAFESVDGTANILLAFSNDPEGDSPSSNDFDFTFDRYNSSIELIRGYIMNLNSGRAYYLTSTSAGATVTILLSTDQGNGTGPYYVDDAGILHLEFTLGENQQPYFPPTGVKSDEEDE